MIIVSTTSELPLQQQQIRNRCFHPTGKFIEFSKEEIEQSVADRFEQQVRRHPNRLAIKTKSHKLTYDQANKTANRIAHAILAQLGEGEEPIALLLEQGAHMSRVKTNVYNSHLTASEAGRPA